MSRGIKIDGRHIVPWIFIGLAVWVAVSVPGEGVSANVNIADAGFALRDWTNVNAAYPASSDITYGYYENASFSWRKDLTASGTVQDFELQFASVYTPFYKAYSQSLTFQSNYTIDDLSDDSVTRLDLQLTVVELGNGNANITSITVGSTTLAGATVGNTMITYTFSDEVQFNATATYNLDVSWGLATLLAHAASYTGEYVFVRINFDYPSLEDSPFAGETWTGKLLFSYNDVSVAQTWLYVALGTGGFVFGSVMLAPAAGLVDPKDYQYYRSYGGYSRRRAAYRYMRDRYRRPYVRWRRRRRFRRRFRRRRRY